MGLGRAVVNRQCKLACCNRCTARPLRCAAVFPRAANWIAAVAQAHMCPCLLCLSLRRRCAILRPSIALHPP